MAEFGLSANEFNTAVYVFAHYLGIDLEKEQSLLSIAETALRTLPDGWSLGIGDGDNEGIPYFFNEESGESVWKHPKENIYLKKVKEERRKLDYEADDKKKKQQQQQQHKQDGGSKSGNTDGSRSNTNYNNNSNNNNNKKTSLVPVNPEDEVLVFDDFEMDEEDTPVKPTKTSATTHAISVEPTGMSKNTAAKGQQQSTTYEGKNSHNKKRQEDFDDDDDDDGDYDEDSMSDHQYHTKKDDDATGRMISVAGKKEESAPASPSALSPKSSFPLGKGKDKRTQQHFDDDDESMGEIEGDFFSEDDEEDGTKTSHPTAAGKPTSTGGGATAGNAGRSSATAGASAKSTDHWPSATTASATAAGAITVDINKARAPSYSSYSPSAKEGMASGASSKGSGGGDAVPWDDWDSEQDNSALPSPAKAAITTTLPPTAPAKSPQSAGSPSGVTSSPNDSSPASPAQAKSRGSTRIPQVIVESDDVTSLRAENKELEDRISGMQRKFDMELENLRSTQAKLERAVEKVNRWQYVFSLIISLLSMYHILTSSSSPTSAFSLYYYGLWTCRRKRGENLQKPR